MAAGWSVGASGAQDSASREIACPLNRDMRLSESLGQDYTGAMKSHRAVPVLLLSVFFTGCAPTPNDKPAPIVKSPYQRFVPIHREPQNVTGVPWSGAFALDTKTGQLCETYEIDSAAWAGLPKCIDLYKQFPD